MIVDIINLTKHITTIVDITIANSVSGIAPGAAATTMIYQTEDKKLTEITRLSTTISFTAIRDSLTVSIDVGKLYAYLEQTERVALYQNIDEKGVQKPKTMKNL